MFAKAAITGTLQAGTTTFDAEYLVVAGGGGGGSAYGGGGSGGYRTAADFSIALGSPYAVTVGAGGTGGAPATGDNGSSGNDSILSSITSSGGGGGGDYEPDSTGLDGGSGGGAGYAAGGGVGGSGNVPATTPPQGNDGGGSSGSGPYYGGGGGGGAGAVGGTGTSTNGGDGGAGLESYITGSSAYRAGGGGGGNYSANNGGAGGIGGGGNAGSAGIAGAAGSANTGGGGGGGHAGTSGLGAWTGGGAGGSGVVIIRVPSSVVAEFSAGVVYNYIPLDDFNVYEVTAAGVSDTVTFSQGEVTTIDDSLRFNDNDSAYLSRTPASAGDRKTWTWSGWVKRGNLGSLQTIFTARSGAYSDFGLQWGEYLTTKDNLTVYVAGNYLQTSAVYRDVSAWYHLTLAVDTTQATSTDRIKIYVNGTRITSFAQVFNPTLNQELDVNDTSLHTIGSKQGTSEYFDGYLSDVYLIDGEALDPSRFGKQDADGVWQPISYTGTYGTNGFHLDFADNSTAAALGTDVSGNSNDWTPSGITTDDQVADTPSVNYATFNNLLNTSGSYANGNLERTQSDNFGAISTICPLSGKWYAEFTYTAIGSAAAGVVVTNLLSASGANGLTQTWQLGYTSLGKLETAGSQANVTGFSINDVIGVAFDCATGAATFYKNGSLIGTATSSAFASVPVGIGAATGGATGTNTVVANFGQRPFAYTPPTGFQALSSANLPAPTITDGKEHFQPVLYTGNGTSQSVRGLEFQPDFVWIKSRSNASWWHSLFDAVRGAGLYLHTNNTNAEGGGGTSLLTSFNSNGFALNVSPNGTVNNAGDTYVAWNWNAGGSTVTNTDGTITSQVRANTTAGFSIVSYTGNGTAGATVGHGLGAEPDMLIIKDRDAARDWPVYHSSVGATKFIELNTTSAAITNSTAWNNTEPTSSVFSMGTGTLMNALGNAYIAYCFHSVDGFSKFGSYTGNGSADGPFVYTGFRPAFVMMKRTNGTSSWSMFDDKRNSFNEVNELLNADVADAEYVNVGGVDFLSNGFKQRNTNSNRNASGGTYIFMAFAENPFKTSRAR